MKRIYLAKETGLRFEIRVASDFNAAIKDMEAGETQLAFLSSITYIEGKKRNILDPLDMAHTSFLYAEIPDSLRVKGHVSARNKPVLTKVYPYNRIHAPSSTLNSNVMEMTHYAMANLHRGVHDDVRILSDKSYDELWTNTVKLADEPAMGVSWFLGEHDGYKTASHMGGDTGFNSLLLLVPEKNISVMLACNYELQKISTVEIGYGVLDILLNVDPD